MPSGFVDYASRDATPESGSVYQVLTDPTGLPLAIEDARGETVWWATGTHPYRDVEVHPSSPHEGAAVAARGGRPNNASAAEGGQQTHTHREWVDDNGRAMGPVPRRADGTFDESNPPPGTRGSRETTTRPDGIRGNDVIEHKHLTGSTDVYHDDQQLRAQREMAARRGGEHELVLTSNRPLSGNPPTPPVTPSTGAARRPTTVYYHDPATGTTFTWDRQTQTWS